MSSVTPYTSYLHGELFQQDLLRSLISFRLHRLVVQLVVPELKRVFLKVFLPRTFALRLLVNTTLVWRKPILPSDIIY